MSAWRRCSALLLSLALACEVDPLPLPSEAAVSALDRGAEPPLYQLLYDSPLLPGDTVPTTKVRVLIWLRRMELGPEQLGLLQALSVEAAGRRDRILAAEEELVRRYAPDEQRVYDQLWRALSAGVPVDAPEMVTLTTELRELRAGGQRERELLALRLEGIRSILDAEQRFLRTLTPRQEALVADALFFLRARLDPVANPGDFRALVGTIYDPGQYAVLSRGTGEVGRQPLNIGGLWAEEPGIEAHALHEARKEVLLFLALLEPGFDEALAAATALSTSGVAPPSGVPPAPTEAPPGTPPPGAPPGAPPPPGAPTAPPGAPGPGGAGAPTPAPPGAPGGNPNGAAPPG
jgi:hypothetical protein